VDRILKNFENIEYKYRQQLKTYLSHTEVHTRFIRENIIEEGKKYHKGILVIEGTLIITKKINHGKVVLAQLNPLQIANI
jgi:hypothetical protein